MAVDWALAVHHVGELADVLDHAMHRLLPDARIMRATNVADAQRLLGEMGVTGCQLIAAGIRVPRSPSDSLALDGAELTTLELVNWVRGETGGAGPPILLLASYADPNRAAEMAKIQNVEVVAMNFDVSNTLIEAAQRLLTNAKRVAGTVDIDIELQRNTYRWRAQAMQPPLEAAGPLDIQRSQIDRLRKLSLSSRTSVDVDFLSAVGEMLYEQVMSANADEKCTRLSALLDKYCGGDEGLPRARIRFIVDEHTYPILLESVAQPQPEGSPTMFWMLRVPIFRRYDVPAEHAPLFKDLESRRRKLDCLLIQGDVSGFNAPAPLNRSLPAIEAARDEVLELEEFLNDNEAAFRIGKVKRIQHDGGPGATPRFVKSVKKALSERTWDLIHYAGHSFGEGGEGGGSGFLVFGPGESGVVDAETFARWVRKSRFLFLSSCQSAGAHFVLQMVKRTVPAIVGYRWKIEDLHARSFAKNFYSSLFRSGTKNRYLEYAFLEAKKALYDSKLPTPAWAAPMLVMQTTRADPD